MRWGKTKTVDKEKSLAAQRPDLVAQWDLEKNIGITPEELGIGSRHLVHWKGTCGHSWQSNVKDRVRGYGCPICSGKRVLAGINDLATDFPEIAAEWDYKKNQELTPSMVTWNTGCLNAK